MKFGEAFWFCLLGYATHGLLDACTSYGTQLLWPFSDYRVAWRNVAVVDPLFTLPLLLLVVAAGFRQAPALARAACAWACLYLLIGVVQRERAESFGREVASTRAHVAVEVEAKPSFGNLLLWKTVYEHGGRYYVDAARMGWAAKSFPGDSAPRLELPSDLPWLDAASQQARDIERFRWFSAGWVALDPSHSDRVIDVRYSMVPNRIQPLWGIHLDPEAGREGHAEFFTSRGSSREGRAQMLRMLLH